MSTSTAPVASPATPALISTLPRGAALTDGLTVARRNLLRILRTPQLVFFSTIQPIMFVLLFNYVFGGAILRTGGKYIDYLLPGIMVQTVAFGATSTAIGLATDMTTGIMDRFRSLPMARSAVLSGRTTADAVRNLFVVVLMVIVGTFIGFRFHNGALPAVGAILLAVLFGFALSWVFAFIGLKTGDAETAQLAAFVIIFPLVFASSAFVPTASMPGWLQAFANHQPVTQTANAIRALSQGEPMAGHLAGSLVRSLLWIAAIIAVFAPLAVARYRKG
jgi:ABC-2 type transport system permease protein/oleandomycin transport system permease protein